MSKSILFGAAALSAILVGDAWAQPVRAVMQPNAQLAYTMLWNQNGDPDGSAVDSQNLTSGSLASYNNQAADDFIVPAGHEWTVNQVDVSGLYFDCTACDRMTSVDIYIYKNQAGNSRRGTIDHPGRLELAALNMRSEGSLDFDTCTDNAGNLSCIIPGKNHSTKGLKLKPGHYWISVVANLSFVNDSQWAWTLTGTASGDAAEWQNPNGGFGLCPTWNTVANCWGQQYSGDLMFDLQGSAS